MRHADCTSMTFELCVSQHLQEVLSLIVFMLMDLL